MNAKPMSRRALALLAAVLLAGCGDGDVAEVNSWMAQTRANAKVQVKPLAEPKTFIPFAYAAQAEIDPFDPNKLLAELARVADETASQYKPDLNRRKEHLESFPLDTFRMVGTMQKGGVTYALLQVDRSVFQVTRGQRLGQNYGLVTAVTEDAVSIKETVQDAAGEWVERMSKLELQESKAKESSK
jgi:type IV pilus assembly protein PilP